MAFLLPCFLFFIFISFPLHIYAQSSKNITTGSSLTSGSNPTSFWASPSKDFAFGFREIEPGSFLLAIWLEAIPEKTITWAANRDHLAPNGSKVELSTENGLVLTDPTGRQIWRARTNDVGFGYGAMLDTGNFILAMRTSSVLWQSFNEPTDTILPTQVLNLGTQLIARFSINNYSSGRFMMQFGTDGNLGLYTTDFPFYTSTNNPYLSSETLGSGYQGVFNQTGLLYLVAKNGSIVYNLFSDNVQNEEFYQRVVIEYDGVLRHYVYPKSSSSTNVSARWSTNSFIPGNICTAVLQGTGSGVCGYNSYCSLGDDSKPYCLCPPGYVLLDPTNDMSGCSQNFPSQSCQKDPISLNRKDEYDFKVLINVDWPLSDYEHFQSVTKDWCRDVCLEDCFCAVSVFREDGDCWKKKLPLSNGRNDSSVGRTTFIKVGTASTTNVDLSINPKNEKSKNKVWAILFGISGLGNFVLVTCFLVLGFFVFSRRKRFNRVIGEGARMNEGYNVCSFTYMELVDATNDFKEEIGRGAFGIVYKGILGTCEIAVKKLDRVLRDANKEFKAEVNAIAYTHHKNLVRLIGYCGEENHRLLVYEYMSSGTLSDFLHVVPKPSWEKRIQIAKGISRGLLYLHEDCSSQIIHCDIKSQNILLDNEYNARISDFGLAKLLRLDQTQTNTMVRGTRGYVAPEWFKGKSISSKVDVYSFGVLLLEIVCCRKNVIIGEEDEAMNVLTEKVFDYYQEGKTELLVEDDVEALSDELRFKRMVKVAMWCIQEDPNLRPVMRIVVQMIEGLVHVPEPPFPYTSSVTFTR